MATVFFILIFLSIFKNNNIIDRLISIILFVFILYFDLPPSSIYLTIFYVTSILDRNGGGGKKRRQERGYMDSSYLDTQENHTHKQQQQQKKKNKKKSYSGSNNISSSICLCTQRLLSLWICSSFKPILYIVIIKKRESGKKKRNERIRELMITKQVKNPKQNNMTLHTSPMNNYF